MKTKNYTYTESTTTKITIVISRYQMWRNYVSAWADMAWDEFSGFDDIQTVADALLTGENISKSKLKLQKLFSEGYTCMLMGDAMEKLDDGRKDVYREIIVNDADTNVVTDRCIIEHGYINF